MNPVVQTKLGSAVVATRAQVEELSEWKRTLAGQRKDWRYHEIVEETILQGFDYRYFVLKDAQGNVRAIQPFFLLSQDLLQGAGEKVRRVVERVRRVFPKFLTLRTLMVGCAAGEGHLDHPADESAGWAAKTLHAAVGKYARQVKSRMIVLKEFPAEYRDSLAPFAQNGYTRIPSLPMTQLNIDYASFDDYMARKLSHATRKDLRRKFKAAAKSDPIELQVVEDVEPYIDEV